MYLQSLSLTQIIFMICVPFQQHAQHGLQMSRSRNRKNQSIYSIYALYLGTSRHEYLQSLAQTLIIIMICVPIQLKNQSISFIYALYLITCKQVPLTSSPHSVHIQVTCPFLATRPTRSTDVQVQEQKISKYVFYLCFVSSNK